jgi:hypothetical protein
VEISTASTGAPSLPIKGAWATIRSYILWQHERGTLQYDIMVTLILVFVFFSPRVISFNDQLGSLDRHPSGVVVSSDDTGGLVYQIAASTVIASDKSPLREQLLHVIEPISGDVSIIKYEPVTDNGGQVKEYRVWVKRK